MSTWWIKPNFKSQEFGPYSSADLLKLAEVGRLGRDHLVRRADSEKFVNADQIKGLFQPANSEAHQQSSKKQNPHSPPPVPHSSKELQPQIAFQSSGGVPNYKWLIVGCGLAVFLLFCSFIFIVAIVGSSSSPTVSQGSISPSNKTAETATRRAWEEMNSAEESLVITNKTNPTNDFQRVANAIANVNTAGANPTLKSHIQEKAQICARIAQAHREFHAGMARMNQNSKVAGQVGGAILPAIGEDKNKGLNELFGGLAGAIVGDLAQQPEREKLASSTNAKLQKLEREINAHYEKQRSLAMKFSKMYGGQF